MNIVIKIFLVILLFAIGTHYVVSVVKSEIIDKKYKKKLLFTFIPIFTIVFILACLIKF